MFALSYQPRETPTVVELSPFETLQAERFNARLYRNYPMAAAALKLRPAAYTRRLIRDDGSKIWLSCHDARGGTR